VPFGPPVHTLVHGAAPPTPADVPRRVAEVTAAAFDKIGAAAEGCAAVLASGVMPAVAAARSVAEKQGIWSASVSYCPVFLPSPHHPPFPLPGYPAPPGVTDHQVLDDLSVRSYNALYGPALNASRVSAGLPPVGNVRDFIVGDQPWLAADPVLAPWPGPADLDVVQTGAWLVPDARPLPADLLAFLDAGPAPVYVGFGSMRAPADMARVAIEAIRTQGRRALVGRGWADLAPIDDRDDCFAVGEVNQQALFGRMAAVVHHGGAGTTTTTTWAGAPQVVLPQWGDQPYFASRVADLGIGVAHDVKPPTVESLSAALSTALAAGTRARAATVAATIRTDGAARAATLLLNQFSPERMP
jgi:vancomycin aglycone glucosyltransferase